MSVFVSALVSDPLSPLKSFACVPGCSIQDVVLKALGAEIVRVPAAPFGTPGKCVTGLVLAVA